MYSARFRHHPDRPGADHHNPYHDTWSVMLVLSLEYGRRTVHCPFPDSHKGAFGYCISLLEYCSWDYPGSRTASSGCYSGVFLSGPVILVFSNRKTMDQSLHSGTPLRQRGDGKAGRGFCGCPGAEDESEK